MFGIIFKDTFSKESTDQNQTKDFYFRQMLFFKLYIHHEILKKTKRHSIASVKPNLSMQPFSNIFFFF